MDVFAKFVAFDLETTGLDKEKDQIIEIGAVKFTLIEENATIKTWKIPDICKARPFNPGRSNGRKPHHKRNGSKRPGHKHLSPQIHRLLWLRHNPCRSQRRIRCRIFTKSLYTKSATYSSKPNH